MFKTVRHFSKIWTHESGQTLRVLRALTNDSLRQSVAPGHRDLGQIAWHLTTAQRELAAKTGLSYDAPTHEAAQPATAAAIASAYQAAARGLGDAVVSQWTDSALRETFEAYDMEWSKGSFLFVLLCHEIHHRGQMTVLMRQAGLRVPGVYGPSQDEQ